MSFDAVLRGASAGTQAAPVQRAVLEETPKLEDGAGTGDPGGGAAAAAGTGAADNWGTGGGMNDKALGGNASGTGAAKGYPVKWEGPEFDAALAGTGGGAAGKTLGETSDTSPGGGGASDKGLGAAAGGVGGAAGGVLGGMGGALGGLVGGTRGGTGNGFVGGETGAGAGLRASDDTKLAGGASGKPRARRAARPGGATSWAGRRAARSG